MSRKKIPSKQALIEALREADGNQASVARKFHSLYIYGGNANFALYGVEGCKRNDRRAMAGGLLGCKGMAA